MLFDKVVHFAGERVSAQAQIIRFQLVLFAKLVTAFSNTPMRSAVADNANFGVVALRDLGTRNEGARGFEFPVQALHIVFEIVGALAVLSSLVMAAAAGEVGGCRMRG